MLKTPTSPTTFPKIWGVLLHICISPLLHPHVLETWWNNEKIPPDSAQTSQQETQLHQIQTKNQQSKQEGAEVEETPSNSIQMDQKETLLHR
jgi:hypothetical protein